MASYEYMGDVLGMKNEVIPMRGMMEIAQSAGWWMPCEDVCFISERPCELHLNEKGQLHRDKGMAIIWPDGWGIRCINGKAISREKVGKFGNGYNKVALVK